MKIGKLTELSNVTFTSSVTANSGKVETNLLDNNTLKIWEVTQADATLLLQFDPIDIDMIGLFNLNIRGSVTINAYTDHPGQIQNTKTITNLELVGLESKNTFIELTSLFPDSNSDFILDDFILDDKILGGALDPGISAIEIIFKGGSPGFNTSMGYIWAGDLIDFGCAEKIQPFDQSQDDITVTRGNQPDANSRFNLQNYNVTIKKENEVETLRDNMREILATGFGTPRPFLFDEPFFPSTEIMLGILDSGKIGYDVIEFGSDGSDNTYGLQTTIGPREVF